LSTGPLRRYAGWAALAAGIAEILELLFLLLFFALELPQGSSSTLRFGYLSDVTPIIAAPINIIVIVLLFLLQRKQTPGLSTVAIILGLAGSLLTAWASIMCVLERISLEQQTQLFYLSLFFLGLWHILINSLARRDGSLPSPLTIFGILVGIGQLILCIGSPLFGGYGDMFLPSSTAILTKILLLLSLVIGILATLLGYAGAPIWLVWLGQTLLRRENQAPSRSKLSTTN
jgi:hypothetical protein